MFCQISVGHKLQVLFSHMRESCLSFIRPCYIVFLYKVSKHQGGRRNLQLHCIANNDDPAFRLIIQEIRKKLGLEIYRFSETQSFNNIFIFSGCYR